MRNSECGIREGVFKTPLGWAGVAVSDQGIRRIVLPRKEKRAVEAELERSLTEARNTTRTACDPASVLGPAVKLLLKYFSGERVSFDLLLDIRYYTAFQRAVWKAAAEIPYGETRSYAWIALRIKRPRAARAVGSALGANPVPIMVPCHRVISSAGTLGGFSGGLELKRELIDLEKIQSNQPKKSI